MNKNSTEKNSLGAGVNNILNGVDSTIKKVDDIPQKLTSVVGDITNELSSINPEAMLNELGDVASKMQDKVTSMAANIIGNTAGNLADSLSKTADAFVKSPAELMKSMKLGSIMDNVADGTKETKTKVESLVGNSSGALESPVSFVTKTQKDVVKGLITNNDKSSMGDLLPKGTDKGFLGTLAERTGLSSITSGSGLSSALKSVSSTFSSGLSAATAGISAVTSGIKDTVGTVTSYIGSGISAVKDTVGGVIGGVVGETTSIVSGITSSGTDLVKAASNILPTSMANKLNNRTGNLATGLTKQVSSYLTGSVSNAIGKIPGGDIVNSILDINRMGNTFNNYPAYGNEQGSRPRGEYSTGINQPTSSDMRMLNKLASQLCPDVKSNQLGNFRNNKDLFDTLLDHCSQFGMSSLLDDLTKCQNYFDDRSSNVIKNKGLSYASQYGDPHTYAVGAKAVGYENLGTPYDDLRFLNGNMSLKAGVENVPAKKSAWDEIMKGFDISTKTLVEGNKYGDTPSYNAPYLGVMSNSNTDILDKSIGRDDRILGLQMYRAFQ